MEWCNISVQYLAILAKIRHLNIQAMFHDTDDNIGKFKSKYTL